VISARHCACCVLVALVVGASAHAESPNTGRLFFTPEQRERLDAGRREAIANRNRPAPVKETPAAPKTAPPQVVTLHGVVKRSDGSATVWVNGKAVSGEFESSDIQSGSITRDSVGMAFPGSRRRVRLKVGQSIEATSGTIEESYQRRRTLPSAVVPLAPETAAEPGTTPLGKPPARRGGRETEGRDAEGVGDS